MDFQRQRDEQLYKKIFGTYVNDGSTEKTLKNYSNLATEYEKDFLDFGYGTPLAVAQTALKHYIGNPTAILDVACGTGLVGEGLRKMGFKGFIDGVDGSSGMLSVARSKDKLYRNLLEAFVTPDEKMSFADNSYDCVVVCGSHGLGHLKPETLNDLVRVTKPNGVIVFTTRYNKSSVDYVKQLDSVIENLCKSGAWVKESVFLSEYFNYDMTAEDADDKALKAMVYCYRKC